MVPTQLSTRRSLGPRTSTSRPPLSPLSSNTNSLQPIKETRAKQSALWRDLILAYCKHKKVRESKREMESGESGIKPRLPLLNLFSPLPLFPQQQKQIFVLSTTDDGPLFANNEINREGL